MDVQDTPAIIDPVTYSKLSAIEKLDYLFEAGVRATAYAPGQMPDVFGGVVEFAESAGMSFFAHLLPQTITRVADELETPKRKLFHSFGTTARMRFDPLPGSPYTGLLSETAHGLVRFSYAGPVVGVGIVPGLGLKFTVDGDHASENAVLMHGLDPQLSRSVFEHPFTNLLPDPSPVNLVMREVKKRFETVVADGHGLNQPVVNFARTHTNGMAVQGEIHAPYRLILVPTPAAKAHHNPLLDFRDELTQQVLADTHIYDVLALDADPDSAMGLDAMIPLAPRIGMLTTESEFIASAYGDYRLFFQHSDVYLRR